jgi:transposase
LRRAMVVGATSLLRKVRAGHYTNALVNLLKRKPPKLAAVALAKKIARIAWKMMITGENYRKPAVQPDLARAA